MLAAGRVDRPLGPRREAERDGRAADAGEDHGEDHAARRRSRSRPTRTNGIDTSATTASCTVVSPKMSKRFASIPVRTYQQPNSTAASKRDRIAVAHRELGAGEQEQTDDRDRDREDDAAAREAPVDDRLDDRGEDGEEPGDERRVRRGRVLQPDVLGEVGERGDHAERRTAEQERALESVGRRPGPAHGRRSANGASTAAPIAKRMRLNPIGVV